MPFAIVPPVFLFLLLGNPGEERLCSPVRTPDRFSPEQISLTSIGGFGLVRKARKSVPSHLHTGIDIRRPSPNYLDEPVYPIADGRVISRRDDGPFAQLILEHEIGGVKFWTLYEHLSGIIVEVNSVVGPEKPVGRFMNRDELNRYGWQFDHVHFEVLRVPPMPLRPGAATPTRFYSSYSLLCFTPAELAKYFYDPIEFLSGRWKQARRSE